MNNLKRHLGFTILCIMAATAGKAQISFGNDGLVIKDGTNVALEGLTITPDNDLVLSNKTLQLSHTAITASPTNSIERVYTFNEVFDFTGTLGIFYLPSELNGNTETDLQIASSGAGGYVTSSGSTVDPGTHYVSNTFNAVGIRVVSAVDAGSVLPVTLISFTATKENETALLKWSTSYETNSDFFEIQQSLNGKDWQVIGKVAARGESNSAFQYSFTDTDPMEGENLYRLKMTDKDKSFAYSSIRNLWFNRTAETNLFPNPVADKFKIKIRDWSNVQKISILNVMGMTVYESIPSQLEIIASHGISTRNLPAGFYLVKITNKYGQVNSVKMIKH